MGCPAKQMYPGTAASPPHFYLRQVLGRPAHIVALPQLQITHARGDTKDVGLEWDRDADQVEKGRRISG